jgi:hypothetical protein
MHVFCGTSICILLTEIHTNFCSENLKVKDYWDDIGVARRIMLEWLLRKQGRTGLDWMHVAQDRDHWQALVNTVINLLAP